MSFANWKEAKAAGKEAEYFAAIKQNQAEPSSWKEAKAAGKEAEYFANKKSIVNSLDEKLSFYDASNDNVKEMLANAGITRESISRKYEQRLQDRQNLEDKWRTRDLFKDYGEKEEKVQAAVDALRKAEEDFRKISEDRVDRSAVGRWFTQKEFDESKKALDDASKAAEVAETAKDAAYSYYKAASENSGLDIEAINEKQREADAEQRKEFYQQQGTTPHDYFTNQRLGRAAMRHETAKNIEAKKYEEYRSMDPRNVQAEIDAERNRYDALEEEYRKQEQLYYDIGMGSGQKAAAKRMKEIEEELSSVEALISEKEDLLSNVKKAKDNEEAARLMLADQAVLAAQKKQAEAEYSELTARRQQMEKDKLLDETAYEQAGTVDPNFAREDEIAAANAVIEQYYAKYSSGGSYERELAQLDQQIAEASQRHAEASQRLKTAKSLQSAREYNAFLQAEDFDSVLKQSASVNYNQTLPAEDEAVRRAVNQQGYSAADVVRNADYQRQQQDYILGLNQNPVSETAVEAQYASLVEKYKFMTADEKNIFNYILEKQGMDPAKTYLDTLEESLNARSGYAMAQWWTNGGNYDKSIGKYVLAAAAGANQFFEGIASAVTGEERAMTPYQYAYQDIDANTHWDALGIGKLAYHGSYTVGNMLPMIAASYLTSGAATALGASAQTAATVGSYAGSAAIGLSSGGNAYNQALREGYTEEQARTYGLLSGASEALLERALGGVSALGGSGGNRIMDLASKMEKVNAKIMTNKAANTALRFISAGLSEGTEEYLQAILDPVYRSNVLGEEYKADFLSDEAMESMILGILTGGIFEASTIIAGNKNAQQYGRRVYDLNQAEELYQLAKEQGGKAAALAEVIEYGEFSEQNKQYALGSLAAVLEQNGTAAMQILEGRYRSYTKDVGAATTLTSPYEGITPQQNESAKRVTVKTQRDAETDIAAMAINETVIPGVSINKGIYSVHVRGGVEQNFLNAQDNLTTEQKQEIIGNLPDIIKNARYVGSDADIDRPDLIRSDHFETAVELEDGTELIVKLKADELRTDQASAGVTDIEVVKVPDGDIKDYFYDNARVDVNSNDTRSIKSIETVTLESVRKNPSYRGDIGYWTDQALSMEKQKAQIKGYKESDNMELAGRATVIYSPYHNEAATPSNLNNEADIVKLSALEIEEAEKFQKDIETSIENTKFVRRVTKKFREIFGQKDGKTDLSELQGNGGKRIPREIELKNVEYDGNKYIVRFSNASIDKIGFGAAKFKAVDYAVLPRLKELIEKAEYVGSGKYNKFNENTNNDTIRYDYFETPLEIDGTNSAYVMCFSVRVANQDGNIYRTHHIKELTGITVKKVENKRATDTLTPNTGATYRGSNEGNDSLTNNISDFAQNVNENASENQGNTVDSSYIDALSPEIEGRVERTPQEKEDLQYIYESVYKDKIAAEDADMLERMTETANEAFERMRKQTKLTKREQKIAEELVTGKRKVFPEGISEEKKHAMQAYMAGYDAYIRDTKKISSDSKNMEKKAYEVLGVKDNSDQAMVDAQRAAKKRVDEIAKEIERLDSVWNFTEEDNAAADNLVKGTQSEDTFSANIQKDGVKMKADLMIEKKNLDKALRAVRLAAKQKIRDEVRQLTVNADYWKDSKRAIGYELRSTDRAFRAAIKDDPNAPEIIRYFATSVHKNNADRVRWVNGWNDKLRPFGELFREADQALAMTNQEGKTMTPGEMEEVEMTARVNKVIEKYELDRFKTAEGKFKYRQAMEEYNTIMRDALKDAIDRANISLVKNGYAPIDLLENYAPHRGDGNDPLSALIESYLMQSEDGTVLREDVEKMRDELLALEKKTKRKRFWESAGMTQIQDDQLNAQLTGMTEQFTPGKKYVANFEHRTGDTTEYNLAKNYDSYIENVSRVIFMTENIQRIRALESELRERNAPETVKKEIAEIRKNKDYSAEEREERISEKLKNVNVGPEGFINWLHEYGNQLAGKKSHWDRPAEKALGRTAMLKAGQAAGWIARNQIAFNIGSALSNFMAVFQAAGEVSAKSMVNAAWDGVRTLKKGDAFAEESDFIVSRKGTERIYKTSFDKIIDAGGWALNAFDEVATNIITRAFYNEGISKGMSHDAAMEFSNKRSADLMGDRSLGSMPTVLSSQMMKPLFQYQLENLNFWYHYLSDFPLYKRENAVENRALRRGLSAEEARKYSEDNKAAYQDLTESEKRRAAMHLTKETLKASIAIFVGNAIMQALRGRKVTYDPLGELGELFLGEDPLQYTLNILGIEDDHEKEKEKIRNMSIEELSEEELDTFWDGLLAFATGLYGEVPVAGTMLTGGRYAMASPFQSFDSATEFFEGIKNGDIWKDPEGYIDIVGNLLNPFGGYGQAKKTVKGVASLIRGGEYNNKGELKHAAADGTSAEKGLEAVKNILFGVGSTDQAQEYYEDYKTILNVRETEGYKNLKGTGIDQDEYLVIAMGLGSLEDDELTGEEIKKEKIAYIQEHYPEDAAFLVEYLVMSKDEAASFEKVRSTGIQADAFMSLLTADDEDVSKVAKVLGSIEDPKQRNAATREIMSNDLRNAYDKVADYGFGEYNYFAAATAAEGKNTAAAKKAARVKAISALDLQADRKVDLARVFDKEVTELDLKYPDVLERYAEIADNTDIKDSKEKAAAFYEYLDEVGYTENQKQDIMMQYTFGSNGADSAAQTSEKNKEYAEYGVDAETLTWAENALRNQEGYYDRAKTISGMKITGEQKFALLKNNVRMSGKKAGMYELAEAVGVDYDDFAEHFAGAEEFYGDEGKLRAYLNDQDVDADTETVIYMLVTKKQKRYNSAMKNLLAKTGWSESKQSEFYEEYSYK